MDERKLVIWFLGGNSVGKTTQARLIHEFLGGFTNNKSNNSKINQWTEGESKLCYTSFNGLSANLGKLGDNACGGTDTLSTKAQIRRVFEHLIEETDYSIVIIEGIMATATWIDFLKREDTEVWVILLDVDNETNLSRLRQRRGLKRGIDPSDVQIEQKTMLNLSGKLRGFRSTFEKVRRKCDHYNYIDTTTMNIERVFGVLKTKLISIIAQESM